MAQTFEAWWEVHRIALMMPLQGHDVKGEMEAAWLAGKDAGYLQGVREAHEKAKEVKTIHAVGGFLTEVQVLDGHPQRRWVPSLVPIEDEMPPEISQAYY